MTLYYMQLRPQATLDQLAERDMMNAKEPILRPADLIMQNPEQIGGKLQTLTLQSQP